MSFYVSSVIWFFSLQVLPFLITASGWYYYFDVLILIHLFSSTGVVVITLANLNWSVFVSIKLSQIDSFHELLVLTTECFFSFDIFEVHSGICFELLMRCGCADCSWDFWVLDFALFVTEICHFLCLSLMRYFVVQVFFIFQDTLWLVKSSWCVHCCSIQQFHWVSFRCRSEFALWWFFVRKKFVVTVLALFLSFSPWKPEIPCFQKFERQSCLFGNNNAFFTCYWYLRMLSFNFSFFLWNHVFLCVYQWCGFSRYKFYHFWSLHLADIIISMRSFWFIYSVLLG